MNYVIENEFLSIEATTFGAELQSIKGKKSGFEYLWQGNPEFWTGRATVIFPFCGRLFEEKYTCQGKVYQMGLHGIVRKCEFELKEQTNDTLSFVYKSNEQTKINYPFDFEFTVSYILKGNSVRTEFNVKNLSSETLPFSVGGHPGFNIPFIDGEKFEDYYVEFENGTEFEYIDFTENKLCSGKTNKLTTDNGKIHLRHDLFDNDAIFIQTAKNSLTLKTDKNNRSVKVTFDNMSHVGLWHACFKPAPYVCIEPWHGSPGIDGKMEDFYTTKKDMIQLEAGKTSIIGFDISITE
ncbi:MAG: aldose 1-epimerase family protein [Clostridia bacterium]|nr:aldose 1-epimerase family protein [Clostridia bacterium]